VSAVPPNCADCELRRSALCGRLAERLPAAYSRLNRRVESFKPRKLIRKAGTIPTSLAFLRRGHAVAFRMLKNGRRQVYDFRLPGDVIGMRALAASPLTISIQALTEVSLCTFDNTEFVSLCMQDSQMAYELTRRSMNYIHSLEARLLDVSRRPAASRVASIILSLQDRHKLCGLVEDGKFEFPYTQSLIGDALGLTQATVNRVMSELRFGKIIELINGYLTIQNEEYLEELANSDDS